ncbi:protocadherin gamma-A11 isoform X22, partial [Tachysurus ichikawai]
MSDVKIVRPYSQNTLRSESLMGTVQRVKRDMEDTDLLSE